MLPFIRRSGFAIGLPAKKPVAVWRGSTTDGVYALDSWQESARSRLVNISLHNDLIDARSVACRTCAVVHCTCEPFDLRAYHRHITTLVET
jgi:hypothetical protein